MSNNTYNNEQFELSSTSDDATTNAQTQVNVTNASVVDLINVAFASTTTTTTTNNLPSNLVMNGAVGGEPIEQQSPQQKFEAHLAQLKELKAQKLSLLKSKFPSHATNANLSEDNVAYVDFLSDIASPTSMSAAGNWNPLRSSDWEKETIPPQTLLRIKKDLREFYGERMETIHVVPDDSDISKMHAIITGPDATPYQYGFFYFFIRFPPDYPIKPPRVKLMTTGNNTVRFNPNLYADGKVCLSILGTWSGPPWSPALNLTSVLLSIQSLMNEAPYHNEPGFERMRSKTKGLSPEAQRYNDIIDHETIRVAVIDMIQDTNADTAKLPNALKEVMHNSFVKYYKHYEKTILEKLKKAEKVTPMKDPFHSLGHSRGNFDYKLLLTRLQALKTKFNIHDESKDQKTDLVASSSSPFSFSSPSSSSSVIAAGTSTSSSSSIEYGKVATTYYNPSDPTFDPPPKEVDIDAVIDDADYYLDADTSDSEPDDEDNVATYDDDDDDDDNDDSDQEVEMKTDK